MISANNITLRVGKKALFEDVNIKFTEGNCYGLIGANGAGKSTFLKILSGQLEPTNGDIVITPGQRLSFLQQDHFKYDSYNVLDTVIMGNARLYEILKEKEDCRKKDQPDSCSKNDFTLHPITLYLPFVYINIIPGHETDSSHYDQQHNYYIDQWVSHIPCQRYKCVIFGSQYIKSRIAKCRY